MKRIPCAPRGLGVLLLCALLRSPGIASTGSLITLDVHGADIHDVVAMLAMQSGANVMTDASVGKLPVTLRLEEVSFTRALSVLARAYDLQIRRDGDILILGSSNGAASRGVVAIRLRYARVEEAVKQLHGVLPANSYVADDAQNAIILTGAANTVAIARSFLRAIDVERPQVSFEVRVADISLTKNSNIGTLFGSPTAGIGAAVTPFANTSIAIEATLNGLIEEGRAKILARPRVVTQNNSEATLLVGESYPIVTLSSNGETSNQDVRYVDIGVKLRITPTIGSDGTIVADLNPEYSELLSVTSNGYPVIGTRKLSATVRVRNDQTIVLGGLLQETDSETVTKVPLLGNVPIFGEIFRNRTRRHERDEIVFLITPHLLH
jgi:type II secretory pathway component GspD/PulD (secretin)